MNMLRIRHIMEMRRASKEPPLLPPKLKRSVNDFDRKSSTKEILNIHISLRNIKSDNRTSKNLMCLFYDSHGGLNGPWELIFGTETFPVCSDIDISSSFSIEFVFERPQPIRMDLCACSKNEVIVLGTAYILISDIVLSKLVQKTFINESTGNDVGQIIVKSTIMKKPSPLFLQFEGKNFSKKLLAESALLSFEIVGHEPNGDRILLYKSETLKQGSRIIWKAFTLGIDNIKEELRPLEVACRFNDEKYHNAIVGSFVTTFTELRHNEEFVLSNPSYKCGKKMCGQFDLIKRTELTTCSFLDYLNFGTIINFAFAIDFSDAEGLQDREAQISFTNNVEFAIRSVGETLFGYTRNNNLLAYGLGARIPPHYRGSHEFCLNLETDPTCVGVDGVLEAFRRTLVQIKPCKNAQFSHVIYHISKNAQNAAIRSDQSRPQYCIINIITRGAIADIKETVQAAIFASKLPVSIIFTGIGDQNLNEIDRLGSNGGRLSFHGRKSERDNLHYVNMTRVLLEHDGPMEESIFTLSEKSLYQIPKQIASYFIKNGVVPMEKKARLKIESSSGSECLLQSMAEDDENE
ncbi:Copine [Dictyocaulus viviparus]|uniref:Copine n=1 Tax=Dictyocaulus viviparus TaxID=29172 RepID=A0A0D8XCE2_DICVI|nr:Copine [Dictyocaulus viviparus]